METKFRILARRFINIVSSLICLNSIKLHRADFIFFANDKHRYLKVSGAWYSPITDSMREFSSLYGHKSIAIAAPLSSRIGSRSFGGVYSINRRYTVAKILDVLLFPLIKSYVVPFRQQLYMQLLRSIRPKKVIGIGLSKYLCAACDRLSVDSIELAHGFAYTPSVFSYDWPIRKNNENPKKVVVYDRTFETTMKSYDLGIEVIGTPNPFLARYLGVCSSVPELQSDLKILSSTKVKKKRILVLLQWGYNGEEQSFNGILKRSFIPEELHNIIISTKDDYEWVFRQHPVMTVKEEYNKMFLDMIESLGLTDDSWRIWTNSPLPSVLRVIDGAITMSSMAAYEAAFFGINTLALCPTIQPGGIYEDFYNDLVESGHLVKGNLNSINITEWLSNVSPGKGERDIFFTSISKSIFNQVFL